MLIKAKYEGDKINVLHAERIDTAMAYCHDLSKDQSNGFTKERTMRRVGSPPMLTLLDYDKFHPGFMQRAMSPTSSADKNKAWREFFASEWGRPFLTVEKILH